MSVEGGLRIELHRQEDSIDQVRILSTRPLQLTRLFEGKPVEELLRMIPMLYSVCATAQACASVQACRQALRLDTDRQAALAEQMLVTVETAREHLWRILIDWSGFAGIPIDRPLVASLSILIPRAKQACFGNGDLFTLKPVLQLDQKSFASIIEQIANIGTHAVFGIQPSAWYAMDSMGSFNRWLDEGATIASQLLRQLRDRELGHLGDGGSFLLPDIAPQAMSQRLARADADRFIAAPDWEGNTYETNPLARQASHPLLQHLNRHFGSGLMTRMVARLLELASIPDQLSAQLVGLAGEQVGAKEKPSAESGQQGLGEVEAARGRLIHRAVQQDGVITSYQILAPTEWNFHPQGVVARGLQGLPAENESLLKHQADLFINAVDPCVGYQLEIA
ncbi:MAG: nickel-dependent hydrogenase large subunit [Candidatus Thiodiazotropha sp. (ex Epidulcina cf. delphinae)]|nr:nickel-dependent hydrogenase large subunit [Candidatus Thiodiazotropha sp. (ex Epidulcina cf. delphinae)]